MMPASTTKPLTREEIAKIEIGSTDVSRRLALVITWSFIASLFLVALVQQIVDNSERETGRAGASLPWAYEIVPKAIDAWKAGWETDGSLPQRLVAVNQNLLVARDTWEDNFVESSWLSKAFLPPVQRGLYAIGTGNEKAVVGREGWLFYRPGIEYLTGPGFLTRRHLQPRDITGNLEWSPVTADPRNAILEFHRYLQARGIQLVLMPAPDKAMVVPEGLSRRLGGTSEILQNGSYARFRRDLEKEGVLVFDPTRDLLAAKRSTAALPGDGRIDFLRTDSHWNPAAMELVARRLAEFLEAHTDLAAPSARYERGRVEITASGDLALMLRLPADARPVERAVTHPVRSSSGAWTPATQSTVLFMGDSYANIFSLGGMGWGEGAGFPEQLSYFLNRPLDTILRNDAGAYATREMLAGHLLRGDDRLEGKKVVVWEFAMRELTGGEWKSIPMPAAVTAARSSPQADLGRAIVRGTVGSVAEVPRPGQVPYADHIRALHLTDLEVVSGTFEQSDALVYTWSMRDNELTAEASLTTGSVVTLELEPWKNVAARLERINRSELDDDDLLLYDPWWGELVKRK